MTATKETCGRCRRRKEVSEMTGFLVETSTRLRGGGSKTLHVCRACFDEEEDAARRAVVVKPRPIGRIVMRGKDKDDGLGLFVLFMGGKARFKPGYVYEIQETLDVLHVVEVGRSHLGPDWKGQDVSTVLNINGRLVALTADEYAQQCEKGRGA